MTIKHAVIEVLGNYPNGATIEGITLIENVRRLVSPKRPFDGSIFRKLREVRKEGKANYHCIDRAKSLYRKEV